MARGPSTRGAPAEDRQNALLQAFSRQLQRQPAHVMAIGRDGTARVDDIDRLAKAIAAAGDSVLRSSAAIVGLAAPNGPAFLASVIAIARAGRTALLLDPLSPPDDRARTMAAIGASALLTCEVAWPASLEGVRWSRANDPRDTASCATGVIKVTSGSTGSPRGVAVSTDQLLADEAALASTMGLSSVDRLLAMVPMSHSYGFTTLALSALVRGLTVIVPGDHGPLAPLEAMRTFGATIVPTVPAYLQALLRLSSTPPWPDGVRRVITAGAVLPAPTAREFHARHGRPVHAFYGSSECGGICYDRDGGAAERGTVGTPVDGVRVSLTPFGDVAGEGLVTVTSPAVGNTYVPEPDRRLADGRFETTDVAMWEHGELVLKRRADRALNVRGRKVDPTEIERVLAALDGVEDVAVTSAASSIGSDDIVSAVVACPSGRLTYDVIAQWCQSRLPHHKTPRRIIIVPSLPHTSRGKIDRHALAELARGGEPPKRGHV